MWISESQIFKKMRKRGDFSGDSHDLWISHGNKL